MAIFTIIGSIIGAGFASGQEIYIFFYSYGMKGIFGLVFCSFLMSYVIYKVLKIVKEKNINTYGDFLDTIFYKNGTKKRYLNLSYINNTIVNIFLLVTFYIMVAGFGAYFSQEFYINCDIGAIIIAILSFLIFLRNIKGLTRVNSIIVPLLIICIVFIGVKNISSIQITKLDLNFEVNNFSWIIKAIIYSSYNLILLIPILVNLSSFIRNRTSILLVSIISGFVFFILAICVFFLLINVNIPFDSLEMPVVYAIKNSFYEFKLLYGLVILISIFTTATSIGLSFLKNVVKRKKYYPLFAGIMCISGVVFSKFGFSNLVKILFSSFGFLGLVQIWMIIRIKV